MVDQVLLNPMEKKWERKVGKTSKRMEGMDGIAVLIGYI